MHTKYHVEITQKALEKQFSDSALKTIIHANIRQDRLLYALGHDHIHFDGSAFQKGFDYISLQEQLIYEHMSHLNYDFARQALGRMLHSWQDFYSHSNYIKLWLDQNRNSTPESILIDDPKIMNHPDLISGKNYGVIEFIALLPGVSRLVLPLMPSDSHAKMNLDLPSSSPYFDYAYWAALKRTNKVFDLVIQELIRRDVDENIICCFKYQ